MKEQVMRYDVYDKKDRWVGSYDASLNLPNQPTAFEMARINWKQTLGKIVAVHQSGLAEEVLSFE